MLKKNYKKQLLRLAFVKKFGVVRPAFVPPFFDRGISGLRRGEAGQAAISFMMVMGGIVILIALLLSLYGLSFLSSSYGIALSQRAYFVAFSGFSDAFLQFLRNKDISSSQYSATIGSSNALITITTDTPVAGHVTISSVASVVGFSRVVSGVLSVNTSTGSISIVSLVRQ